MGAGLRLRVGDNGQLVTTRKALQRAQCIGEEDRPGLDRLPVVIFPPFKYRRITWPAKVPVDFLPEGLS